MAGIDAWIILSYDLIAFIIPSSSSPQSVVSGRHFSHGRNRLRGILETGPAATGPIFGQEVTTLRVEVTRDTNCANDLAPRMSTFAYPRGPRLSHIKCVRV